MGLYLPSPDQPGPDQERCIPAATENLICPRQIADPHPRLHATAGGAAHREMAQSKPSPLLVSLCRVREPKWSGKFSRSRRLGSHWLELTTAPPCPCGEPWASRAWRWFVSLACGSFILFYLPVSPHFFFLVGYDHAYMVAR